MRTNNVDGGSVKHTVGPWHRRGLAALAFLVLVVFNYNPQMLFETGYRHWGWNLSLLASILIIAIIRYRDPESWREKLGIPSRGSDRIGFVLSAVVLLFVAYYLVDHVAAMRGYAFMPKLLHYPVYMSNDVPFLPVLGEYMYYIPETLNEEMLLGAFLLMGLERNFRSLDVNVIAIMVALLFCLMHQAMYMWSPVQGGVVLTTETLLSLFVVGLIRNALILKTRQITFAWALHLSFNLIFFPGFFIDMDTKTLAGEPERFNIVFGNWAMVLAIGIAAIAALVWLNAGRVTGKVL